MASNDYAHLAAQAWRTVEIRKKMNPSLRRQSQASLFARELQKVNIPTGMRRIFIQRILPDTRMMPNAGSGRLGTPRVVKPARFKGR